jgi:hypothetical protein
LPQSFFRIGIRHDDGPMELLPVLRGEILEFADREILQELVGVEILSDRLNLQERDVGPKLDRGIGLDDRTKDRTNCPSR